MNTVNLLGAVIFGSIGVAAFIYGKKQVSARAMIIGIALIAYPYFVTNTLALYAIGIVLTVGLFFPH